MLEKMKALIREYGACVMATVGPDDRPHASLMSYLADHDCRRIYMLTGKGTRKYRNVLVHPQVSLLIDTRTQAGSEPGPGVYSLTLDAEYMPLPDGEQKDYLRRRLVEKHPHLAELNAHPDSDVMTVKVKNLQLLEGPLKAHYATMD